MLGLFPDHLMAKLTYNSGFGVELQCPVLAYLIRGEGVSVLVDTGCSEPEWSARYHHTVVQTEDMLILNALAKLGESPESITFLVNTHLHWDHVYNNHRFPGKKIYVQKREIEYALDPYPLNYFSYETAKVGLRSPWIDSIPQFDYAYGDREILPGMRLVALPGHSPGLQGVLVDTEKGKHLIASDCVPSYEVWQGGKHQKHFLGAVHTSVSEYYDSLAKIEAIDPVCILPGHDLRVLDHECYPY
jgi:glyoxylase-like metal-dependent hydrolase (beta-lactamase superfamily II)